MESTGIDPHNSLHVTSTSGTLYHDAVSGGAHDHHLSSSGVDVNANILSGDNTNGISISNSNFSSLNSSNNIINSSNNPLGMSVLGGVDGINTTTYAVANSDPTAYASASGYINSNQYSYPSSNASDGSSSQVYDGSNSAYSLSNSSNNSNNAMVAGAYSQSYTNNIPIAIPLGASMGMQSMVGGGGNSYMPTIQNSYNLNYGTQNMNMSLPVSSSLYSHHHFGSGPLNTSVTGVNGGSIATSSSNMGHHMGPSTGISYPIRDNSILNLSAECLPDDDSDLTLLTDEAHDQRLFDMLHRFWDSQTRDMNVLDISTEQDFKNHNDLPLARIKRIMKSDEDVRMISAEAPVLFAKACEMFILELSIRSWGASEKCKRRTLLKEDVDAAIKNTDIFDFLEGLS